MSSLRDSIHPPRIAIIGGGISGLTAAHRLMQLRPEAELTLFESSDRIGGALETRVDDRLLIERGADSFITTLPAALDLCRELDLHDELIPTNTAHRRAMVVCRGKLQPAPAGFVLMAPQNLRAIWRSPILSLRGKLRLMIEPWVGAPPNASQPDHDESVGSFARRRLGWEAYERLVQPLMAGIYVANAEKLSLAATQPKFLAAEREFGSLRRYVRSHVPVKGRRQSSGARYDAFMTLRGGVTRLIDSLVAALPQRAVQLHTHVARVDYQNDRWIVNLADGRNEEFTGVVIAAAAPHAATMLEGVDSELAALLDRIRHASSAVVSLAYKKSDVGRPLDAFGVVVPAIERLKIIAVSASSVKFPGRAPDDVALFRVFVGGVMQPDLVELPDDELIQLADEELSELLEIDVPPVVADLKRWREAMPQYEVGHVQLVDSIERRVAQLPGLQLAGNAYRGVGIPHCVAYARTVAERLHESLGETPGPPAASR